MFKICTPTKHYFSRVGFKHSWPRARGWTALIPQPSQCLFFNFSQNAANTGPGQCLAVLLAALTKIWEGKKRIKTKKAASRVACRCGGGAWRPATIKAEPKTLDVNGAELHAACRCCGGRTQSRAPSEISLSQVNQSTLRTVFGWILEMSHCGARRLCGLQNKTSVPLMPGKPGSELKTTHKLGRKERTRKRNDKMRWKDVFSCRGRQRGITQSLKRTHTNTHTQDKNKNKKPPSEPQKRMIKRSDSIQYPAVFHCISNLRCW